MMKYFLVTGGVSYVESCTCPNCDGHDVNTSITQTVMSDGDSYDDVARSAIAMAGIKESTGYIWEHGPIVKDITLETIERAALSDWNAQRPTTSPLALAMARGEL
jgi:deoxycytidylate deaminase